MKNILIVSLLLCGFNGVAETKKAAKALKSSDFKMINVAELEKMQSTEKDLHIFDANRDSTREKEGIIPGAKLLTSSSQYDTKQVLPASKEAKLVFYCANTQCTASHTAAKKATDAGFKNVHVFSDGIEGWKKAGKPTEKFNKTTI